jgi:hypothetical protein
MYTSSDMADFAAGYPLSSVFVGPAVGDKGGEFLHNKQQHDRTCRLCLGSQRGATDFPCLRRQLDFVCLLRWYDEVCGGCWVEDYVLGMIFL